MATDASATGGHVASIGLDAIVTAIGRIESRPAIVGIGGAVSVGKSTFAADLITRLGPDRCCVVGTDGFLYSNDVLTANGWFEEKGQPHTYDEDAIVAFLSRCRTEPVVKRPTYSHDVFDVVGTTEVTVRDVVVIEGVNALQPRIAQACDVTVFVDAAIADIKVWYAKRFEGLTDTARRTGEGFYTRFAALSPTDLSGVIDMVWETINQPNFDRFINPSRGNAAIVVRKASDHSVVEVRITG